MSKIMTEKEDAELLSLLQLEAQLATEGRELSPKDAARLRELRKKKSEEDDGDSGSGAEISDVPPDNLPVGSCDEERRANEKKKAQEAEEAERLERLMREQVRQAIEALLPAYDAREAKRDKRRREEEKKRKEANKRRKQDIWER